jgi:hypothetical protein
MAFTRGYTCAYESAGVPAQELGYGALEDYFADWHEHDVTQRNLRETLVQMSCISGASPEEAPLAKLVDSAQVSLEQWRVVLEMWDGMIAETKQHGWTEDQARVLIISTMLPKQG